MHKPCPFCGGPARARAILRVACVPCHAHAPRHVWNARSTTPPPACPLCGGLVLNVHYGPVERPGWTHRHPVVQHVTCASCGLTMAGLRPVMPDGPDDQFRVDRIDAVAAWGNRAMPDQYRDPRDRETARVTRAREAFAEAAWLKLAQQAQGNLRILGTPEEEELACQLARQWTARHIRFGMTLDKNGAFAQIIARPTVETEHDET